MRVEAGSIKLEGGLLVELYERHASDAGKLEGRRLGDRELAEDLVQDAFVKLTGRFVDVRDPGGLHAYLRLHRREPGGGLPPPAQGRRATLCQVRPR